MQPMSRMALEGPLPVSFKLVSASVPVNNQLGSIKGEPRLLLAYCELSGDIYPIVVDTGATISCLPDRGRLMTRLNLKRHAANLNVQMANNNIVHINEKVTIPIRPAKSN